MSEFVEIKYNGNQFKLPVITGSEGEKAIDISKLRQETGFVAPSPVSDPTNPWTCGRPMLFPIMYLFAWI